MMKHDKQKLLEYLYPTEELMDFMCNDVYQELLCVTPESLYISVDNINDMIREENLQKVKKEIVKFILDNKNYKKEIFKYYKHTMLWPVLYDILVGLTFYVASVSNPYQNIDIFSNKKSICCGIQSILNFV